MLGFLRGNLVCRRLSLSVVILRLRFFLNSDMFYNSVGTIRKNIQKSRKIIFVMGLGAPKMPKMSIWHVFGRSTFNNT